MVILINKSTKIFIKYFILLLFFIISIYLLKYNKLNYKYYLFDNSLDYSYFRSKINFIIGKITNNKNEYVSSIKLEYKNVSKFNNSYKFETDSNYVLNNLYSGIVIFIGEKPELGNTIIVNGDNGVNYWYSNLNNINVSLYDYIDKNIILGSVDNYFYLTLIKNNEYLAYEKYI